MRTKLFVQLLYQIDHDVVKKNERAGVPGFEPGDAEIKTRCLTTWRHPKDVYGWVFY